jgi:hypothetical protein
MGDFPRVPKSEKSEQYRRFAEECVKMAAAIQDEQARAILMQMAQVWFRLSNRDDPASNDEGS